MTDTTYFKAYLKSATEAAANMLMDVEANALVNAGYYERSGERTAYRNGYRTRRWRTEFGTITLHIPKLRSGSYYPAFLDIDDAEATFERLALAALVGEVESDAIRSLLNNPHDDEVAEQVAAVLQGAAASYLSRPLRYPYPVLHVECVEGRLWLYGERTTGTRHLLDICEDVARLAYWRSAVRGWAQRGLQDVQWMTGAVPPELERAMRLAFPNVDVQMPQTVMALGVPIQTVTVKRNVPHGMLPFMWDASLDVIVDTTAIELLRQLMKRVDDAVGEPLQIAA